MRALPVLVVAVAAALAGPLATTPRDRPAGAPFMYTPPEGFEPATDALVKNALGAQPDAAHVAQKVWIFFKPGAASTPNVTLNFTDKSAQINDEDLRALAAGMPAVFSPLGSTWTYVRHEVRRRADGSRVGLLDGEIVQGASTRRVVQVVFPLDKGAALVTVTVPSEELVKWEPKIDASIASATGVAVLAPKVPAWVYAAWGAAGAVLAYLALAIFAGPRGRRAESPDP